MAATKKKQADRELKANSGSISNITKKTFLAADLSLSKYLAVCAQQGSYRPMMKMLELSGHGIPWIIGCIYIAFTTENIEVLQITINFLALLLFDLACVGSIKTIAKRSRPSYNKADMICTISVDNYSFPSGHATRAMVVMGYTLLHLKLSIPLRILLRLWCMLIGLSRVILGRHHISDVLAGFIIGYLEFVIFEKYLFISQENCFTVISFFAKKNI